MPIPWLKLTVLSLMIVVLLKLGGLLTGIIDFVSTPQPSYVHAQEALPTPGSDPIAIPNNQNKRDESIDLGEQGDKINLIDQETRGIVEDSEDPVYINRRTDQAIEGEQPQPVPQTDWSQDQIAIRENETFTDLLSKRLDERESVIRQRQAQLEEALNRYDSQNDERILRLVSVYSNMKAKAAARIFNDLDLGTLLPVAQNIIPRKLAPILADMDPEKAGVLSEELSGRNQDISALRTELNRLKEEQGEIESTKQELFGQNSPLTQSPNQPPSLPAAEAIDQNTQ